MARLTNSRSSARTLLLSASDVRAHIDERAMLSALRDALMKQPPAAVQPKRAHSALPGAGHSTMIVFPGVAAGIPAYTVKVNAKIPAQKPSVVGIIALNDMVTGAPLALMDSTVITEVRTALMGAIAADVLASKVIRSVAVIGAGVQGRAQLRALRLVREFSNVRVFDTRADAAASLIEDMQPALGVEMRVAPDIASASRGADVVIVATWSKEPLLFPQMLSPGAHVTTIGADEPGKAELSAEVIRASVFVCDDLTLAGEMGALAGAGIGPGAGHAMLHDVLAGRAAGRRTGQDLTVFASVGLPLHDLVAAWIVFQRALASGRANTFDLYA